MNPNIVRNAVDHARRAKVYQGAVVQTTDSRKGKVERAVPVRDGVIELHVVPDGGSETFVTDSEHATIVRAS